MYRARDSKLGRDVAIKVLPEKFSTDKERLDRFEKEAKLLAQLNHSNIATLHGLEESAGQQFLVMELVEGETLAERIAKGPLPPIDEAEVIALFIHIAEGLEAAHEKGIIHRDLKPANIKISPDGKPKILDFGLAKAFLREENVSAETSQLPTLTKGTALGMIMGTASYMSPEQAKGKHVDTKTDVWAFGCCLYEALTGKKAFDGETPTDTIAAVVNSDPRWSALPSETTSRLRELIERCLRKDSRRRLHHIGDARLELEESTSAAGPDSPRGKLVSMRSAAAVVILSGLAVGWATSRYLSPSQRQTLTSCTPPFRFLSTRRFTRQTPLRWPSRETGRRSFTPRGSVVVPSSISASWASRRRVRSPEAREEGRPSFLQMASGWVFSWAVSFAKCRLRAGRRSGFVTSPALSAPQPGGKRTSSCSRVSAPVSSACPRMEENLVN